MLTNGVQHVIQHEVDNTNMNLVSASMYSITTEDEVSSSCVFADFSSILTHMFDQAQLLEAICSRILVDMDDHLLALHELHLEAMEQVDKGIAQSRLNTLIKMFVEAIEVGSSYHWSREGLF